MVEAVCAAISAFAVIMVAIIQSRNKKVQAEQDRQAKMRAKENKLSMDMIYACCLLSKGTAIALKNNHFNSEVDHGIELVDKCAEAYNKFLRETAADSLNI